MNQANCAADFGTMFPAPAARTVPAQKFLTAPSRLGKLAGFGHRVEALLQAFEQRRERLRIQRVLARLDDRLLRDIGLSRADVAPELELPFLGLGEPLARAHGAARGVIGDPATVGLWHL